MLNSSDILFKCVVVCLVPLCRSWPRDQECFRNKQHRKDVMEPWSTISSIQMFALVMLLQELCLFEEMVCACYLTWASPNTQTVRFFLQNQPENLSWRLCVHQPRMADNYPFIKLFWRTVEKRC